MSEYDNGYARAAAMYDAMEPPNHDLDRCECGEVYEEHADVDACQNCGFGRQTHPVTARAAGLDGPGDSIECRTEDFAPYDEPVCPNGRGHFREAGPPEPDPDRARDERIDREFDPPEDYGDER